MTATEGDGHCFERDVSTSEAVSSRTGWVFSLWKYQIGSSIVEFGLTAFRENRYALRQMPETVPMSRNFTSCLQNKSHNKKPHKANALDLPCTNWTWDYYPDTTCACAVRRFGRGATAFPHP